MRTVATAEPLDGLAPPGTPPSHGTMHLNKGVRACTTTT